MDTAQDLELTWIFRTLHNIATGLKQLHGQEIAHQDLKPSSLSSGAHRSSFHRLHGMRGEVGSTERSGGSC